MYATYKNPYFQRWSKTNRAVLVDHCQKVLLYLAEQDEGEESWEEKFRHSTSKCFHRPAGPTGSCSQSRNGVGAGVEKWVNLITEIL